MLNQKQHTVRSSLADGKVIVTNIVVTEFCDGHFVMITQNKKVGTLMTAWAEENIGSSGGYTYETRTLMGKRDDPVLCVYARRIMESIVSSGSEKPLLLAICILEEGKTPEIFHGVIEVVLTFKTW